MFILNLCRSVLFLYYYYYYYFLRRHRRRRRLVLHCITPVLYIPIIMFNYIIYIIIIICTRQCNAHISAVRCGTAIEDDVTFSASSRHHQSRWTFQLLCRRTPSTYYIVIIYGLYNINRRGRVSCLTSKSGLGNPRSISRRGRTSDNITIVPHARTQQYNIILYALWVYGR